MSRSERDLENDLIAEIQAYNINAEKWYGAFPVFWKFPVFFYYLEMYSTNITMCLNIMIKRNFPFFSENILWISLILDFISNNMRLIESIRRVLKKVSKKKIYILYPHISLIKKFVNSTRKWLALILAFGMERKILPDQKWQVEISLLTFYEFICHL